MMKICIGANDNGASYKIATMKTERVYQMEVLTAHEANGED